MSEPSNLELFPTPEGEAPTEPAPKEVEGAPRMVLPQRHQVEWAEQALDDLVAEDHPVRGIWAFIERLDLGQFEKAIRSVEGSAGRPAADRRVMLALWVYATSEGIGSGRELDKLTREHLAYRWLRGGVPVDYHTLNDFRTEHREAMDEVLTQVLGVMMQEGLVQLHRISQDGTRVRASAGAASFHRGRTLERHLAAAREQVERLAKEAERPDGHVRTRQEAARERAAQDRLRRVEKALEQLPQAAEAKLRQGKEAGEARVSSTDPEARVMKMGDGGFRPAYNVQLAVDTASQAVVGVDVTNVGSDMGRLPPMLEQIEARTGRLPKEALVDGGFADHESLGKAEARQVTVYAPVPESSRPGVDPHAPKPSDPPSVAAWRERMATEEAKKIYKERAATVECVNGTAKEHRGLRAFRVRGQGKVLGVALLFALTHNILRYVALTG